MNPKQIEFNITVPIRWLGGTTFNKSGRIDRYQELKKYVGILMQNEYFSMVNQIDMHYPFLKPSKDLNSDIQFNIKLKEASINLADVQMGLETLFIMTCLYHHQYRLHQDFDIQNAPDQHEEKGYLSVNLTKGNIYHTLSYRSTEQTKVFDKMETSTEKAA